MVAMQIISTMFAQWRLILANKWNRNFVWWFEQAPTIQSHFLYKVNNFLFWIVVKMNSMLNISFRQRWLLINNEIKVRCFVCATFCGADRKKIEGKIWKKKRMLRSYAAWILNNKVQQKHRALRVRFHVYSDWMKREAILYRHSVVYSVSFLLSLFHILGMCVDRLGFSVFYSPLIKKKHENRACVLNIYSFFFSF